jgi:hypothetical protein
MVVLDNVGAAKRAAVGDLGELLETLDPCGLITGDIKPPRLSARPRAHALDAEAWTGKALPDHAARLEADDADVLLDRGVAEDHVDELDDLVAGAVGAV